MDEELKRLIAQKLGLDPDNIEFIDMREEREPTLSLPKLQQVQQLIQKICKETGLYYTHDTTVAYKKVLEKLARVNDSVKDELSGSRQPEEFVDDLVFLVLLSTFTDELLTLGEHDLRKYVINMRQAKNTKH